MSGVKAMWLVARREIRERTRTRGFKISTALSLAAVLALAILPSVLADDEETTYDIALVGQVDERFADDLTTVAARVDAEVDVTTLDDRGAADAAIRDGDVDAAIVDGTTVVVEGELGTELEGILQAANAQAASIAALDDAGVTGDSVADILAPAPLTVDALDPPDPEEGERTVLAIVAAIVLFGQIFQFGTYVAGGVAEEKSSRVLEVLLSKVTARQQLAGKVLGIGAVGFVQIVLISVVGLAAAVSAGSLELPEGVAGFGVTVAVSFVLGFALYACLFAMAGALASRTEELQSTSGPVTLIGMASYFATIFAGSDPESTVGRVLAVFPTSSPFAMPTSIAQGAASPWEIGLAVALILVSVAILIPVAARVHSGAALFTRGQLKLGQALKRAKA